MREMDYTSLDDLVRLIDQEEEPRALRGIATEGHRLAGPAQRKAELLAHLAGQCEYCDKPLNQKQRCPDNHCQGWLP